MKKIISVILATAIIFGTLSVISIPSFAAGENISMDTAQEITLQSDISYCTGSDHYWYKFIPDTEGNYTFASYFISDSVDPRAYLRNSSGEEIMYNDDTSQDYNFSIGYYLLAGETYYLECCTYTSNTSDKQVGVTLTKDSTDNVLTLGEPTSVTLTENANNYYCAVYKFVPAQSGDYSFKTDNRSFDVPYIGV